ncbi:hypothetical protein NIES4102_43310 (plasmid) [Chondrocystis sp. NIES-4102]|nr:hypothetical protein NIES4102_43310 [Chondrocystis sp. NIES-4102]
MIDDFNLEEDLEYPEELYPVVKLSDSILELTEKLELIRVRDYSATGLIKGGHR